jgi:hypothetical protein
MVCGNYISRRGLDKSFGKTDEVGAKTANLSWIGTDEAETLVWHMKLNRQAARQKRETRAVKASKGVDPMTRNARFNDGTGHCG